MKWLNLEDLELIHMQIVDASSGAHGIRDRKRLDAALAAQRQKVFGHSVYATIFEKAAVLMRGIIADHPFLDGNKRTGVMSALIFLNLNGYDTSKLTDKELEDFAVQVAVEKMDVKQIAAWLKKYSNKK